VRKFEKETLKKKIVFLVKKRQREANRNMDKKKEYENMKKEKKTKEQLGNGNIRKRD